MGKEIKEVKSIETVYNGYRFRSRLEARVAVLFDALGIEYQYEPEGFEYKGDYYLPDFYVPKSNFYPYRDYYVEVKPIRKGFGKEIKKAINVVVNGLKKNLLIITEIPDVKIKEIDGIEFACDHLCKGERPRFVMASYDSLECYPELHGIDFCTPGGFCVCKHEYTAIDLDSLEGDDDQGFWKSYLGSCSYYHDTWGYINTDAAYAFSAARQARFEHGQTPNAKDLRQGYEKRALDYINSCEEDEDDD